LEINVEPVIFQLLSAYVNLGGDKDQVVLRGPDDPITYPENILLGLIHEGPTNVHGQVIVGQKVSTHDEERLRLSQRYGETLVNSTFPMTMPLPTANEGYPTQEEVDAATKAASDAAAKVRAKRDKAPAASAPAPVRPAVPSLEQLPE
jgi:hypothetical protein